MRRHVRHAIALVATATTLTGGLLASTGTPAEAATAGPAPSRYSDDFNGDGYHDLAIGSPDAGVKVTGADGATTTLGSAGYVTVSYGGKYGAQKTGLKVVTQNSPGVPGDAAQGRRFGEVLTSGDFNADGYADLAVGTGDEQVALIWGSATGLKGGTAVADPLDRPGYGVVLKAGDFTGDGKTDLVVGYSTSLRLFRGPFKADGSPVSTQQLDLGRDYPVFGPQEAQNRIAVGRINKGAIDDLVVLGEKTQLGERMRGRVLLGGASGLRFTPVTIRGGNSIAIADFDKDGYGDIAVGDAENQIDTEYAAGLVRVNYGSSTGVDENRSVRTFTEDSAGIPGSVERTDRFGSSVAAADLNLDGYPELIVGAPGERKATCEHCYISGGGFYVLKSSSKGVTGIGSAFYAYNAPGLPRPAGTYRIPWHLKTTDLNNDKQPEITIPVRAGAGEVWSVGTKDGKVAGTSPTVVVKPPVDPQVGTGYEFGVLAR
ncbi:FG-GAP and VCBS repeat-containing protein [Streptomyces sp. NPDC051211]|uniref:FG-GAP and VCBS repeat-containing protein n=1 Tax=Streptomyces sp. NPDC051211 TaxID=3154643 RepID=UPI00344FC698